MVIESRNQTRKNFFVAKNNGESNSRPKGLVAQAPHKNIKGRLVLSPVCPFFIPQKNLKVKHKINGQKSPRL